MKPKTLTVAIVFAIAVAGLFGPGRQPSSGQTTGREGPCGCYTCYWQLVPTLYVYFPSPPKNCYGIVSASACHVEMAKMPDKGKAYCQKVKKELGITSFNGKNCPEWAAACPDDEEKPPEEKKPTTCKEREGPPWFDPSAPGCQNLQETRKDAYWTPEGGGTCTITVRACNYVLLTKKIGAVKVENGRLVVGLYDSIMTPEKRAQNTAWGFRPITYSECKPEVWNWNGLMPPQRVCCDIWQEAVRSGGPCNPEIDADCDGISNSEDSEFYRGATVINRTPYYAPGGTDQESYFNPVDSNDFNPADFDPRPPGLAWDELMPNEPCKKCKWVAQSGKLTCSPDGQREHEYKATWKCPTSGVVRVVTKRVSARFPCTPPNRQSH